MGEHYIQNLFAERIGGSNFGKDTEIYKFEKIKRAKAAATKENPGIELIDMGVGEPDQMADAVVIEKLYKAAQKPENRGYADNGGQEFKDAAVRYMEQVFGVKNIDSNSEILHLIGAKSGLSIIPKGFIDKGDYMLTTVPGYPVLATHTKYLGGEIYNLPITEENNFLPDLKSIPAEVLAKSKLLYINYPNNPTGASATVEFFEEVVDFARKNNIVVIHDAAYAALTFDGVEPLSFLSVPGAKEVGVEIHSLSKSYNMTGWRLGFVTGNELVVKAIANIKDNSDSGQFLAIQEAGIYALDNPQITKETAAKYSRRHDQLVEVLRDLGFNASKPKGSFFLYVKIPKGIKNGVRFNSGEEFSQFLIKEALISTVPWDDAGNYVRFSVTFVAKDEADEKRVIEEIRERIAQYNFEF